MFTVINICVIKFVVLPGANNELDYALLVLSLALASSPGLQLCGGKAWYRLHAHARAFCKICRIRIRTDIVGLYIYGQFYGKVYGNLAHAYVVDTRPSLRIIEGLGTRLVLLMNSLLCDGQNLTCCATTVK